MTDHDERTREFEAQRGSLRAIAFRMLGSLSDADDAVQETWLRLRRVEGSTLHNPNAWLRTVVSRVCLDMLRSRKSRREELVGGQVPERFENLDSGHDPEYEAVLADSVGRVLLVVLDRLSPAERVAFVLHDMFAVPFAEIAPIVERTVTATKKLASRARQRVKGTPAMPDHELTGRRRVIEAFLAAARNGDIPGLLTVLDPDIVRHADHSVLPPGVPGELRGARDVAAQTIAFGQRSRLAETALVNGEPGVILAPAGRLRLAIRFTISAGRIREYQVIAEPARLRGLSLAVLDR